MQGGTSRITLGQKLQHLWVVFLAYQDMLRRLNAIHREVGAMMMLEFES